MSLPRFTRRIANVWRLALPVAALFVAGCASSGSPAPQDAGKPAASRPAAGSTQAADGAAIVVPPKALTLFEQATAVMAAGDFLDAELRFQEFLMQYPQYPGAHVNLAIIRAHNGDEARARAAIDAALEIDPNYAPALNQLGMLLRRNGNFLEAEAAYLKAVTVSPDYALAHYNLGVLNELYLQRLDVALQHFESYQSLVGGDEQVEKWISDLTRRVAASQRTANVAD